MPKLALGRLSLFVRVLLSVVGGVVVGIVVVGLSQLLPVGPVAKLKVTPAPPFPGDTVTVENASEGEITRCALWITEHPWPSSAALVGNSTLSIDCPDRITLAIPRDLRFEQDYWVHIMVEGPQHPFVSAQSTPALFRTISLPIDRAPTARIVVISPLEPAHPTVFVFSLSILVVLTLFALALILVPTVRRWLQRRPRRRKRPSLDGQGTVETAAPEHPSEPHEDGSKPVDPIVERFDALIAIVASLKDSRLSEAHVLLLIAEVVAFLSSLTSFLSFFGFGR